MSRTATTQDGSAMIAVLAVITILSTLAGALLLLHVARHRFIRRDVHRLQARYAAEAGVYMAFDRLREMPTWRPQAEALEVLPGQKATITVTPFGALLYVRAAARVRRNVATLDVLAGARPPEVFRHAVVLWDVGSTLNVAGTTHVTGDVVVGPRGVRESAFEGRRFSGAMNGRVHLTPDLAAPFFDTTAFAGAMARAEGLLRAPPPSSTGALIATADLHLTPADSTALARPLTVIAQGDLTLTGPITLPPGSRFIAGGMLRLVGAVGGHSVVFYSRTGLHVAGARCAGQFLTPAAITVSGGTHLAYPTLLYTSGASDGRVVLEAGAVVDGLVVYPPRDPPPGEPPGRIRVEAGALVRGAVFNGHETEMHGALYGALLTHQLYFYASPTRYVNWLRDATVDATRRPLAFLLPLGFSAHPRLAPITWSMNDEDLPP